MGSTFGRGHLSHGCVMMAFVRMSTEEQVGFLQERKLPEWELTFLLANVGYLSAPGRWTDPLLSLEYMLSVVTGGQSVCPTGDKEEYGEPWVVVLLRGHMQGSLAQAWCRCRTPREWPGLAWEEDAISFRRL